MNNEFVMVPRDLAGRVRVACESMNWGLADEMEKILAQPTANRQACTHGDDDAACMDCLKAWGQWPFHEKAAQRQGEPVAPIIRAAYEVLIGCVSSPSIAAHLDVPTVERIAKRLNDLLPGYAHADPGEVERLLERIRELEADEPEWSAMQQKLGDENETLRAQLAERNALLSEALCHATRLEPMSVSCFNRIDAALAASAEPAELKQCAQGYGHGGHWCGTEYKCWLDPRSKEEIAEANKGRKP